MRLRAHAAIIALLLAAAQAASPSASTLERAVVPQPQAARTAPLPAGVARTAVDRKMTEGLTGSLGFLCGIKPKAMTDGASAAYGVDPHGRFIGGKLSLAF